ncbi:PREDICTED: uncharacterized protein LOC100634848 [Amphimedon queenslandica]|uniref:SAM domain-containing protein n=1 Tax=Amphimedon queenslandica TaxID=400682 RepID=A0A1X7VJ90_AMPQE|nr:PREDICTED: uncharacterized protein LOC100634848 [Amphimedon queenslandica]|eukprot:XP_003384204.2 PREDICTED: uncharacterized protein LOC100634848 [Amphimedon queenslandica]
MALRRTSSSSSSRIKRYSLNFDQYSGRALASATGGDTVEVFKDALKRMDSVLGIGVSETSTFGHESKVVSLCKQLQSHVVGLNGAIDSRLEIPPETREFLVSWLTGDQASFAGELQRDRDTLLQQVMTLEKNLDTFRIENENLKKELKGGRVPLQPLHNNHSRSGSGITPASGVSDSNLKGTYAPKTASLTALTGSVGGSLPRHTSSSSASGFKRQRSFRESFRKAFGRKSSSGKDVNIEGDANSKPLNTRAQSFHSLSGSDLAAWMNSIGLEMYGELISQLVVTGERLASIAANTEDLVRLGVLNVLHCKKLKLAVEDAVADAPSVLSYLDHHWVAGKLLY